MPHRRNRTAVRTERRALPKVCWSVAARKLEQVSDRVREIRASSGKFVELRLDYLTEPELAPRAVDFVRRVRIPSIATLRSVAAGGNYAGSLEQQLRILAECGKAGATIIDLEIESAERAGARAAARLRGPAHLLVSYHNYVETPEDTRAALARIKVFRADYYKLVATSARHSENAALLELNEAARGKIVAFAMGEIGMPARVLAVAHGAPFTYAAFCSAESVAPGQLTGRELLETYRIAKLSARTGVYGVIGNPIAHSLSPAVHNAAFAAIRQDAVYLPFRVEMLEDFLQALPVYRPAGFSITIPHKEGMVPALDWIDDEAREIGAVNTVVVRGGKLRGYNTDLAGIVAPLEKRMRLRGKRVLVAGAGGAARAATFALARRAARVVVVSRRPEQAAALAEQVGGEVVERNSLSSEKFDAIVHATPLGMHPDTASCFFSPGELNAPLLFETVYNPAETTLVRMARSRRMEVIAGLEMFLEQAARQFELWTGRKAPRAIMERAAAQGLEASVVSQK